MSGIASIGQVRELVVGVGQGVPSNISESDARRNLADLSQIQSWLKLGLGADLSRVDMARVKTLVQPNILEQVATITTPNIPAFDVAAHIRVMTNKERETAEVPIGWMNDAAKRFVKGLIEPETPEANLTIYRLLDASRNDPIIAQLRGDREVQAILTSCGQMYEMMKAQGHGEQGNLLTNGYGNIFYIPDKHGNVWTVDCFCGVGNQYWGIVADPVAPAGAWGAELQVISR